MQYCYLDIETLGLDPFRDKLVGVGFWKSNLQHSFGVEEDEKSLLVMLGEGLSNFGITPVTSILVTFNGDYFDVPFLICRGLKHGIDLQLYVMRHLDLMWVVKKYLRKGSLKFASLKELAEFLEIPHDDKTSGADVPKLYAEGKLEKIKQHMKSDVELLVKVHEKLKNLCDFDLKVRYRI